jgi:hypothetical protein
MLEFFFKFFQMKNFDLHAKNPLQKRIKNAQTYDTEVSQALESVLRNGP